MDRRDALSALGAALAAGLAGCGSDRTGDRVENGSFEDGLAGWTVGRDLPIDPNKAGSQPVDAQAAVSSAVAADGEHALSLFIDGSQDDGTLWVQQALDLAGVDRLALQGYSEQESVNTIAKIAAYAGPETDLSEADFDTSAASEDHAGWKTYEYAVDHDGEGLVAVGISVVWETEVRRYLDDVRVG